MEKSTGLAVIALVIALSSLALAYLENLPRLTTLSNHIDALEHQINDMQDQQLSTTVLTVPFSQTLNQADAAFVRELIPRPSESFISRAIMVTFEYQLISSQQSDVIIGMIYADPSIQVPTQGNVVASQETDLPESAEAEMSFTTGLISQEAQAEELVILIAALNVTGTINGTITQIIIR
jgi:hypothetical protein